MTIPASADRSVRNVGLSGIAVTLDRLRAVRPDVVDALAESMRQIGLTNPITLRPREGLGYYLIAGRHRLEAARKLKWGSIQAIVLDGLDVAEAELMEIDENLIRADLSPAERAIHVDARKTLYEKLHPETKRGSAGGAATRAKHKGKAKSQDETQPPDAFIDDTTKKTGKSRATTARDAKRGKDGKDWLKDVVGTSLDQSGEIDALIDLLDEKRDQLIAEAQTGKKVSAKTAVKQEARAERERTLATKQMALPEGRYGVIYADPEWKFEVWSQNGMDRSADNHYPTSALDVIKSRNVADIAAEDCVLFLWATAPMLPDALQVMEAWGFEYKSHCIWAKDRIGTGYWFRNQHELLLVGTRGNVPAPAMGTQIASLVDAPVGRHSEKPDAFYELIEKYFPNLRKVELNARAARAGWDPWGYEAPSEAAE